MKTKTTVLTAAEVIEALVNSQGRSPAHRANATRKFDRYVAQRVQEGKKETQVRAAIQAHVTRRT